MKASLLARVAPTLVLCSALAGGLALPSYAQTTPPQSGAMTQSQGSAVPTTGSAAMTQGSTGTAQSTATTPQTGAAMPQNGASSSTAQAAPNQSMQQIVEQRITDLHRQLHITSAQEPKWNKFATVMRTNARQLDQEYRQRADKLDSMNALQNMQSYASIEKTRVNDVEKLVPAFRTLYASLSPQQKRTADQLFRERAQQAQQHRQASTK